MCRCGPTASLEVGSETAARDRAKRSQSTMLVFGAAEQQDPPPPEGWRCTVRKHRRQSQARRSKVATLKAGNLPVGGRRRTVKGAVDYRRCWYRLLRC